MSTVNLKFSNRDECIDYLLNRGWYLTDSILHKDKCDIIENLPVTEKTGVKIIDDEGFEYDEMVLVDGYHVNLIVPDSESHLYESLKINSPSFEWYL